MFSRRQATACLLAGVIAIAITSQPAFSQTLTWKQLSLTTSPPPRMYPAMAYDAVSKKLVLFGGLGANGNLNDTWAFDGNTWTQLDTPVAPPVRNGASMAFDLSTNKLVMFGGFDVNQFLQDTWVWDGATSTWTEARMPSPPPPATGAMLFTDPLTGKAIMFGGYNSFNKIPAYNRTWRWTGTSWLKLNPATAPYPRGWGIAVLDPIRRNVVLTGGNGDTIRTDNTWTWDGKNWTLLSPARQIPSYVGAGAAFDPAMHAVAVFCAAGDTWSWTGNDWVQLNPVNSPSPRSAVGMAFDIATHQVILFGGQLGNSTLVNTTWRLLGN